MKMSLRRPCANCPFRSDIPPLPLTPAHASKVREMLRAIVEDGLSFACHQTNQFDEAGEALEGDQTYFCAGAMRFLEQAGRTHPEMEKARAAGTYTPGTLDESIPVYRSLDEMFNAMAEGPGPRAPGGTTDAAADDPHQEGPAHTNLE